MTFHAILVATDFSPPAKLAVARAAVLAKQHQATLHLIHVLPHISWKMFGQALLEHPLVNEQQLEQAARKHLTEIAQECRTSHDITVHYDVASGVPYQQIAAYARLHAIDLTVLGPHDDHIAHRMFIGSTAMRYLQAGPHPALIVETSPDASGSHAGYKTILVAVDGSDISVAALEAAAGIAPGAVIHALLAYDVMFEGKMRYASVDEDVIRQYRTAAEAQATQTMQILLSGMRRHGPILTIIRAGYPAQVILDEARNLQADLIVMGRHARSGLESFFPGSVTKGVLEGLDRDLLIVGEAEA